MEFSTFLSVFGAIAGTLELMRLVQWLDEPRKSRR